MSAPAPLAISTGDPAGIGPELLAQCWDLRDRHALAPFFAVGGARLLKDAARSRGLDLPVECVETPDQAVACFADALPVVGDEDSAFSPGVPSPEGARFALASLSRATQLALDGKAGGLITAPVAKSHLAKVGFTQPGQTEFVADACGIDRADAVMMLAGPSLRTVPLTIHIALVDVPRVLTCDLIVRQARVIAASLARDFGIERPRLALCGLNPHAGEDGRFGNEEQQIIVPAIAMLRAEGLAVSGPHPADTLFAPHVRGTYDVALAMYHDQALIPIKTLDFDSGVNVTLGLPIVRTSPDHGTAFGIAGRNEASPGAMLAAIRMAGECAAARATRP